MKKTVEDATMEMHKFPTLKQAKKIRELSLSSEEISVESVVDILMEHNKLEVEVDEDISADDEMPVNLERREIRGYFPKEYTAIQIESAVIEILKEWFDSAYKRINYN